MQTGRKILNLRCDRKVSQQDLARSCEITPSALSKIEAGINSPRANILWRIAKKLGVTVEYLLDEAMPYPYHGYNYRQDLFDKSIDPSSIVRAEVELMAVESSNGKVLWRCPTGPAMVAVTHQSPKMGSVVVSSPAISGSTAYIGGIDGKMYGIDINTGKKIWEYLIGAPIASSAAVSGNAVVIGAYDGNVYAFVGK